jgi:hypothetical protein
MKKVLNMTHKAAHAVAIFVMSVATKVALDVLNILPSRPTTRKASSR